MNHMIIDWEFRFKFVGLSLERHFALFLGYCLHFTICERAQTCYQVYYELLHAINIWPDARSQLRMPTKSMMDMDTIFIQVQLGGSRYMFFIFIVFADDLNQ